MKYETYSLYTKIFWLTENSKIDGDIFFDFLGFIWPKFIEKEGFVFLEEQFKSAYYTRLVQEKGRVEFWMNLLMVDGYFQNEEDFEEKSEKFVLALIPIWKIKIEKEFPDKQFIVRAFIDKEVGDYGLTFYQEREQNSLEH